MKLAHSSQLKRSSQPTGNGESWNRASPTRTMARCRSNRRPWGSPGISLAIVLLVATMLNLTSGTHASIGVGQEDESNASLRWVGTRPEPLTAAEREAKLQKLIDEFESQNKDKPLLKEEKLFNLLQGWKAMYEREGQAAIQKWYETAKEDVFTIAGHGTTDSAECKDGDSGGEKLGPEKEAALLHSLQIWDAMYESSGKYAVFDWYDLARYNIFDMPKFPSVHYAEYETDPSDLFYLNSRIDSQHGTHYHLMEYFECFADRPNMMVEAYNDETIWRFLRYLYVGVVGPEKSSLRQMDGFGFEVPVRFAYAEGKGRGIYAVEDIPKDTVVMNSSLFCAKFWTARDFRRFVASLPPNLACDVLVWSYGHAKDELDPTTLAIMVDMDGGGMMNDGGYYNDEYAEPNNLYRLLPGKGIYVASRDIKAGEELQMDYSSFASKMYRWDYFGLE